MIRVYTLPDDSDQRPPRPESLQLMSPTLRKSSCIFSIGTPSRPLFAWFPTVGNLGPFYLHRAVQNGPYGRDLRTYY
ncbi:hypothetical protein L208DRAFT_906967 [Tricholoma matsutake]|nr:hypothetical protein L208DRAFT_906967 [Tricholoma matsutake 945]